MGEPLVSSLSMETHHHLSTLLSMDPFAHPPHPASPPHPDCRRDREIQWLHTLLSSPPDINVPLSADHPSPPPQVTNLIDSHDVLDVNSEPLPYEAEVPPRPTNRKCTKRGDSVWGAWFFFNFYFKPVLNENSKARIARDANCASAVDKSDLRLDVFMVQHDMENMYMWVFKERPENALGKMQLRSYMNGHSRQGEPQFPFSADKGFMRSHRMQRKHYRGLSNPQCVLGIEVVRVPNLTVVSDADRKKWMELTGRDVNFAIPREAGDFESWRNLSGVEFELERPLPPPSSRGIAQQNKRKTMNGSGLNLVTQTLSHGSSADVTETSSGCSNRRKDCCSNGNEKDCPLPSNSASDHSQDIDIHPVEPRFPNDFNGVIRHAHGPVTAAKTIYEDDQGYLIMISLPFVDLSKVKVSWKNKLTHGIVKLQGVSTAGMPYMKRHRRTFKLTDASPEHCPPGEFTREISLPTRIPEDANLEAYGDESGTVLEILVPKHSTGPEEHEVPVCLRPPFAVNELLLT